MKPLAIFLIAAAAGFYGYLGFTQPPAAMAAAQVPAPAPALSIDPEAALYTYRARIASLDLIYDGDTAKEIEIDLGFDLWLKGQRARLARIDAPELSKPRGVEESAAQRERRTAAAEAARDALRALLDQDADGKPDDGGFLLRSVERDAFGRLIAEIWVPRPDGAGWINASDFLLTEGHAAPYLK